MTFQFGVFVGFRAAEVFKVFTQNRIQQCRLLSRSLTFHFAVEVFKVFAQDRFQQLLNAPPEHFQEVFRTFPRSKKCGGHAASSCQSPRTPAHGRRRHEVVQAAPLSSFRPAVQPSMEAAHASRGVRGVPDAVVEAQVGLDSAAVLLVAGRGRRVPVRQGPVAMPVGSRSVTSL